MGRMRLAEPRELDLEQMPVRSVATAAILLSFAGSLDGRTGRTTVVLDADNDEFVRLPHEFDLDSRAAIAIAPDGRSVLLSRGGWDGRDRIGLHQLDSGRER